MTYEEGEEQEKLLPSSLHHNHPGAAAQRVALSIFSHLRVLKGQPGGGSQEGVVRRFLTHMEPTQTG